MSEENINIATKEYTDAHFGNTSETDDTLVIATKEYVDSIPPGMRADGTALKGQLCNPQVATTVGDGADGSTLTDGTYMFYNCTSLTSWTVDLPNLTYGNYMFYGCTGLTSFSGDLHTLTDGSVMFFSCVALTSFSGDLRNLTNGTGMFASCTNLAAFSDDLPNITNAKQMFQNCILDEASVLRILNSIPTYTSGSHPLHLGKRTNYLNSAEIATLLGTTTPIAAATNYSYKGWTITVQA